MLRLRHAARLGRSIFSYAIVNRAWWILPVTFVLGVAVLAAVAGQAAAPYTIYTLF